MSNPLSSIVSITKPISGVYSVDFQCKIKDFEKLSQVIASDLEHLENPEDDDAWLNQLIDIRLKIKNVNLGISMPHVSGEIRTSFFLACQNCLQAITKKIELPINLILCDRDREDDSNNKYDYWEILGDSISMHNLIEEILILSVPLYTKHEADIECLVFTETKVTDGETMHSPFSDLKNQLNNKK
jgi:uncharacterized metal-binding protein YceD (DUF177 family)